MNFFCAVQEHCFHCRAMLLNFSAETMKIRGAGGILNGPHDTWTSGINIACYFVHGEGSLVVHPYLNLFHRCQRKQGLGLEVP